MSRWAPRVFQPTIQKDSVLVEWEVDAFPDSESPDTVIVELGKGGPRKFLDGDERSIELSAAELSPFAGITLAVNIGFQWDDGEEKWSFALIFIPAPGDGPPLPPPPLPDAPPAPTSLNVSLQSDRLAILKWKNPVSYDKILVRWGPKNIQPTQFEIGAGVTTADCGPIRSSLKYVFSVKGGISRTFGGFNYSPWTAVEFDAPEIPWKHSVPSFGHEKVAAGTSPTSWYTTPENVQHIAYVGGDQQIHELFFKVGAQDGWKHNVPSAGHEKVAAGTSPTSWYTTPENVQHIAYVGADQQIHELFFKVGAQAWKHNVSSAGHEKVAAGTSPTSWYTTPENVQHIAYVGADQQIHELFFKIGAQDGWKHNVPSAGHEKVAAGTSPTSWYTTPENVQHIAYVGADQQIHELFFFVGGQGGWKHAVPGASQENVAPGTSPTSWYTTQEKVQHIAYVGTDRRIHQCYFFVGGFGGWRHEVTSANHERVAPRTSPTSWYTTPENVQHIAYVGNDMDIHELFFIVRSGEVWHHRRLAAPGQPSVEPGTSPTSWFTTPENVQHIAHVGNDKQIHELFYAIF
jgi:hypothetical protein